MAKRMKSKIQPAELKLAFKISKAGTAYIDLSQSASIINRRFYRQGLNWAVSHFSIYKSTPTETGSSGVLISKLPNSWIMSNAWEKSFRAWQKMNQEALSDSQSVKPKFLDFKVFMDALHHKQGAIDNLLPRDYDNNVATPGEWIYSKVVIPETTTGTGAVTEYELIAIGPNNPGPGFSGYDAKSLIEGYASSRGLPNIQDPNTPDDAANYNENWMLAMTNEGTLQDNVVMSDLISDNNEAPYPFENDSAGNTDTQYPGGANQLPGTRVVGAAFFNAGTNANKITIEGDNFPCGLIKVFTTDDDVSLIVHMVPGPHRGYLAESMTEM